ncbi:hypothetical protein N7509_008103 [Penicillium cosmopolitanum]|uniref:CN hydrolase domain-containing protein n=1 Tax=Penicillium cosmopolitanum TaxID=1131564 RepID=A0A9W9W047_9EURO|nr:uncharacterized protein N7509_008103 [Penicillium cosmopolitanum]KAJ5392613.1 hypothetical protein N7509_008103 [Penicillium cosmopolitanum]
MAITRVAACHAAPHFLCAYKTAEKAISLIHRASKNKANLIVFPETFISAFPIWSALRPPTHNHILFQRMVYQSIYANGEEVQAIRDATRETNTTVSIGISEKSHASVGCLYNSNLIIDAGEVVVHHRKLVPTFFEKLTWSPGDGHGLRIADTKHGRIGALMCGENTNPLARYSLMGQREQIHISSWPAVWPTRLPSSPLEKRGEGSQHSANYDNVLANRIRAGAHCFEAKSFGVMCSAVLGQEAIDMIAVGSSSEDTIRHALERSPRGVSMFLDPTGSPLRSLTVDDSETGAQRPVEFLQNEEGVLYADLDLERCVEGKQYRDVVEGYQRLDVFQLQVNRERQDPVVFK